jgi:hypothetical protein
LAWIAEEQALALLAVGAAALGWREGRVCGGSAQDCKRERRSLYAE